MSRLEAEFGEIITFVDLNIDDRGLSAIRTHYGIRGRTEYVLVDADDNVVRRWFGPLSESDMRLALQEYVDSLSS